MIGLDEVGRGTWAGPLVVGAVELKADIEGLDDSKRLSPKTREKLNRQIKSKSNWSLGWVEPAEIDELGLSAAMSLGVERALAGFDYVDQEIIIDGNVNYLPDHPKARAIIGADGKIPCVSAASVVAKVARDEFMVKLSSQFPEYGFESHVGYGTLRHRLALEQYGLTSIHRRSFKPMKWLS